MGKDDGLKAFFSDNERYADVVNGLGFQGRQVVSKEDLLDMDTQEGIIRGTDFLRSPNKGNRTRGRWNRRIKYRDAVRKVGIGVNFVIVGIENQEEIDYSLPLRNLVYDADEYERQASKIRKRVRKNRTGLSAGEYMYGFRKSSRLYPVVTFILYYGSKPWDGPRTLHQLLDFQDIPDELRNMVANYRINLVEIRKLEDTSVFRTDVKQVFDFIRCSEDMEKLKELVEQDPAYQSMEEDAFHVVAQYASAQELLHAKEYYQEGEKVDMCKALTDLIAQGKAEGLEEGKLEGLKEGKLEGLKEGKLEGLKEGKLEGLEEGRAEGFIVTCKEFGVSYEDTQARIRDRLLISDEDTKVYMDRYWGVRR